MKKTLIFLILLTICFYVSGCMSANQLAAEKSYYQMQADIKRYEMVLEQERIRSQAKQLEQLQSQKTLEIKTVDPNKPIVLENVEINAYALPQIPQQPVIINSGNQQQIPQYVQRDYAAPWLGLVGDALKFIVPAVAAYKIIDSVGKNAGTSMTNYGASSTQTYNPIGNTSLSGTTIGSGDLNVHSDLTSTPTVVDPVIVTRPEPLVVRP